MRKRKRNHETGRVKRGEGMDGSRFV